METVTPQTLRYPLFDIIWDYLKALTGVLIGITGLFYGAENLFSQILFGSIFLLFGFYGIQNYKQQITRILIDQEGVEIRAFSRHKLRWNDIEEIDLRYYGRPSKKTEATAETEREKQLSSSRKEKGILRLVLKGKNGKISCDSGLYGFRYLVWCSTQIVKHHKPLLDPHTVGNMLDMGFDPEGQSRKPDTLESGFLKPGQK